MSAPRIKIVEERCKRCGMCVEICPEGLFVQRTSRDVPTIRNKSACTRCGHCVSTCRQQAVQHSSFPPEDWLQ